MDRKSLYFTALRREPRFSFFEIIGLVGGGYLLGRPTGVALYHLVKDGEPSWWLIGLPVAAALYALLFLPLPQRRSEE